MFQLLRRFTLILFIAVSFQATAQSALSDAKVDSLLQILHLPALDSLIFITERATLSPLYTIGISKNFRKIKSATLHQLFQKIENLAADHQNPGLEMYAGLWQYYTRASIHESNTTLEKIVEKATNSKILWIETTAKFQYAYWLIYTKEEFKNIEKGIWFLRENIEKIHKKNDTNISPSTLLEHYRVLTSCYYNMDDIPNAIIYSVKALNMDYPRGSKLISTKDKIFRNINNNLGVYYRENQQLDSSTYYFKRVFNLPLTHNSSKGDSLYNAISGGNLGENLYLQGNYNDALPLLQKDADFTTKVKIWGNASNALILIADIYLKKGDLEKAKEVLDKAIFAAHSSKEIKRLSKLYPVLSKYYKAIDQPYIALTYADSTFIALDSLKRKNNQFRGAKVEEAYNKHQIKIAAEKEVATKNSNIKYRNIGLIILVLLLFIGYFIFRKFKQKAKQQELKLVDEVAQVSDKLSFKEEQLDNKIQEINAKKNAVNWSEFKIYSDEQWEKFLILFEKEHLKFIYRSKTKYPSLTAGETRLFCVTRLGLKDSTAASVLGVNVNSVIQTRRRFMRKYNIESLHEFKELIFNI
jgi:tetratricopeptide (TPR) repeat protein